MMVWLDSEWKEEGEAVIGITDRGFLRGEGVFETLLALQGRPFELERHWERLERGSRLFELTVPSLPQGRAICEELLARNGFGQGHQDAARVRLRITNTPQHLLMTAELSRRFLDATSAKSSPFPRNERGALVGVKAISYGENIVLADADPLAMESLVANTRGEWCEGTWSNLFAVDDGELLTPPLSSGCLPGVTRAVVIELAREKGLRVREVARPLGWLRKAEEIFLTSSLQGVVAITRLDGCEVRHNAISRELSQALTEREIQTTRD